MHEKINAAPYRVTDQGVFLGKEPEEISQITLNDLPLPLLSLFLSYRISKEKPGLDLRMEHGILVLKVSSPFL